MIPITYRASFLLPLAIPLGEQLIALLPSTSISEKFTLPKINMSLTCLLKKGPFKRKIHIPTINFQEVFVSFQGGIPGRDSCPLIHIFGCSGWKSLETGGKMLFAALHGGDDVVVWKLSKRKLMKLACVRLLRIIMMVLLVVVWLFL